MEKIDLVKLDTERRNARTENIDRLSTLEMILAMNREDETVAGAVKRAAEAIAAAVDLIYPRLREGGRLFYVGAGNSGRLGLLDACECPPTFGVEPGVVIGILAGGPNAAVHSKEGAEDDEEASILALSAHELSDRDAVVGLSASGRTPYVKSALRFARQFGAKTIAISCSQNSEISKLADLSIELITGAEVITGSTRLKAGTAQKMALNMISTGCMIKLGKVYGNYMVDVRANNQKLVERGKKILMDATGVSRERAESLLGETAGKVKPAVLMALTGLGRDEALRLLAVNDGTVHKALRAARMNA